MILPADTHVNSDEVVHDVKDKAIVLIILGVYIQQCVCGSHSVFFTKGGALAICFEISFTSESGHWQRGVDGEV
jgi:hypothetical protein